MWRVTVRNAGQGLSAACTPHSVRVGRLGVVGDKHYSFPLGKEVSLLFQLRYFSSHLVESLYSDWIVFKMLFGTFPTDENPTHSDLAGDQTLSIWAVRLHYFICHSTSCIQLYTHILGRLTWCMYQRRKVSGTTARVTDMMDDPIQEFASGSSSWEAKHLAQKFSCWTSAILVTSIVNTYISSIKIFTYLAIV